MSLPEIVLKDVSFRFNVTRVLQSISLEIFSGEYMGIFGPNGGGKTTFLQLILGFYSPTSGTISVMGTDPKKARGEIGYVPQRLDFDSQFPISVLDVVLMGSLSKVSRWGRFPKEEKKKAEKALDLLGIADLKNKPFGDLSGGQIQRALIARAITRKPKILLLDEPTANVDPSASKMIKETLLRLKGSMTILHVTHELADITKEVDRMLCFQNTLHIYTPKQVCEHFAHGLYHAPLTQEKPK